MTQIQYKWTYPFLPTGKMGGQVLLLQVSFFFFLNKNKIKSLVDEKQFDQSPPKIVGYFIDTFLIFGLAALRSWRNPL